MNLQAQISSNYPLRQQLHDLFSSVPDIYSGIMVMNADTGKVIYQHNGYAHFLPASTTKLFTAIASLYGLKPDYRYTTALYKKSHQEWASEYSGDFYILFTGDPSLEDINLAKLINQLPAHGVKTIKGSIILDTTTLSGSNYPQGITFRDIQWGYGAPVNSLVLNKNSVPIFIDKAKKLGKPLSINVDKKYRSFFPLSSHVVAVTMQEADTSCEFEIQTSHENHINIQGCWPIDKATYTKLAVINPEKWATSIIQQILDKHKIHLTGKIKSGKMPKNYTVVSEHKSLPLSQLLNHMLKFSDNLYANIFLKTLGTLNDGKGNFQDGLAMLTKILSEHTDINFNKMVLRDGAGLSNYNLVSPYQLNQLLYATYHSPFKKVFMQALAKPDENGTLSHRMNAYGLSNHIQAKTGRMTGTTTLAGYLQTANRQNLIFAFMINNYLGNIVDARKIEDQMLTILHNNT